MPTCYLCKTPLPEPSLQACPVCWANLSSPGLETVLRQDPCTITKAGGTLLPGTAVLTNSRILLLREHPVSGPLPLSFPWKQILRVKREMFAKLLCLVTTENTGYQIGINACQEWRGQIPDFLYDEVDILPRCHNWNASPPHNCRLCTSEPSGPGHEMLLHTTLCRFVMEGWQQPKPGTVLLTNRQIIVSFDYDPSPYDGSPLLLTMAKLASKPDKRDAVGKRLDKVSFGFDSIASIRERPGRILLETTDGKTCGIGFVSKTDEWHGIMPQGLLVAADDI